MAKETYQDFDNEDLTSYYPLYAERPRHKPSAEFLAAQKQRQNYHRISLILEDKKLFLPNRPYLIEVFQDGDWFAEETSLLPYQAKNIADRLASSGYPVRILRFDISKPDDDGKIVYRAGEKPPRRQEVQKQ